MIYSCVRQHSEMEETWIKTQSRLSLLEPLNAKGLLAGPDGLPGCIPCQRPNREGGLEGERKVDFSTNSR